MRNQLIHGYFGIDWQIVWDVVKKDLPVLKRNIQKIMQVESSSGENETSDIQ
jgi:uncharacterized protein with HEPN domain